MKHITIPGDLQLVDDDGNPIDRVITYKHWLLRQMLRDKRLNMTATDALRANDIAEIIEAAQLEIALGDSDWEWLGKVINAPTNGYPSMVARQYIRFIKAYRNASDKSSLVEAVQPVIGSAAEAKMLAPAPSGEAVLKAE